MSSKRGSTLPRETDSFQAQNARRRPVLSSLSLSLLSHTFPKSFSSLRSFSCSPLPQKRTLSLAPFPPSQSVSTFPSESLSILLVFTYRFSSSFRISVRSCGAFCSSLAQRRAKTEQNVRRLSPLSPGRLEVMSLGRVVSSRRARRGNMCGREGIDEPEPSAISLDLRLFEIVEHLERRNSYVVDTMEARLERGSRRNFPARSPKTVSRLAARDP